MTSNTFNAVRSAWSLFSSVARGTVRYYGTHTPLSLAFARSSWAQYGEDLLIADCLGTKEPGFYVDVGAYNPFSLSNTYYFYRRGWTGINIDPLPKAQKRLRRHRRRDVNIQIAVAADDSGRNFAVDDVFSGILTDQSMPTGGNAKEIIRVNSQPLRNILRDCGVDTKSFRTSPNFLSVDCEGSDLEVLQSSDWNRYPFAVVAVEDHQKAFWSSEIYRLMTDQGYALHGRSSITSIFVRRN